DAVAEHLLPEAVDRDARRQRMAGLDEPLGETEAVARQLARHGGQDFRRGGGDRATGADGGLIASQRLDEGDEFLGGRILRADPPVEELVLLGGGELI